MQRMWSWHSLWSASKRLSTSRRGGPTLQGHNLYYYTAAILLVAQFVPSSCVVGQKCDPHKLNVCSSNEMCTQQKDSDDGTCQCLPGFTLNNDTNKCERAKPTPDPPSANSHLGLGLGLGITFFLLLVMVVVAVLHRKFGLLSGLCSSLPPIRIFGTRNLSIVDNEDDVNPIV